MAISFISAASGTNTATLGTHAAGDVILVYAYRDGNVTAPTLAAGFTAIANGGASANSMRVAYKIAANSSQTVGTWTNATAVNALVYRGCDQIDPIGAISAIATGSSSTATFNALTLQNATGSSWVSAAAGFAQGFAVINPPTGLTTRTTTSDATGSVRSFDTNAGVTSWTSRTGAASLGSNNWAVYTLELLEEVPTAPTLTVPIVIPVSSTSGTPRVTTNKPDGTLYMVVVANGDTPSTAQIKAGQNSAGAAAINAQSLTVTATGNQLFTTVTGLTTDTPYAVWFVHTNSVGDSGAVKADFTPTAFNPNTNSTLFWSFP